MNNKFILNLENQFHGIHTRLKELHFSAPTMSIHKLIDDFDGEFQDLMMLLWKMLKLSGDLFNQEH